MKFPLVVPCSSGRILRALSVFNKPEGLSDVLGPKLSTNQIERLCTVAVGLTGELEIMRMW